MFNLVEASNLWMLMCSVMLPVSISTWVICSFAALESAFDFSLSYLTPQGFSKSSSNLFTTAILSGL